MDSTSTAAQECVDWHRELTVQRRLLDDQMARVKNAEAAFAAAEAKWKALRDRDDAAAAGQVRS